MHPLDCPVWASLNSRHEALSWGGALARRYLPDVNLFAAARDESAQALAALADLIRPDESVYVLQVPTIAVPPELLRVRSAAGVQRVAEGALAGEGAEEGMVTLAEEDGAEMLALARLTEPGPFVRRTHVMGRFLGIRIDGRLVAMAGERLRLPGFTEVSGVCTHPQFRGRGLARRLSAAAARAIEARGERPFLHAWKTNLPAISLYRSLGFKVRAEVNVAVLQRPAAQSPR